MNYELLQIFWDFIKTFVVTIITMKEAWIFAGIFAVLAMYKWKVEFRRRL